MHRDLRSLDGDTRAPCPCFGCDRAVGGGGCAVSDSDAAGVVRGRGPVSPGGQSWAAWPTSCYRASPGDGDHPGKYADTAIPALIAEFDQRLGPYSRQRLTAKLAGGASMFQVDSTVAREHSVEHRPAKPRHDRADPGRAVDSHSGSRSGRELRPTVDTRHRFGQCHHQGSGRRGS